MWIDPFALIYCLIGYILCGHKVMFDYISEAKAVVEQKDEESTNLIMESFVGYFAAAFVVAWWPIVMIGQLLEDARRKRKGLNE